MPLDKAYRETQYSAHRRISDLTRLTSHAEFLGALGISRLARHLKKDHRTVGSWKQRNSIPGRYFIAVAEFAVAEGHDVSVEDLALAAAEMPSDDRASSPALPPLAPGSPEMPAASSRPASLRNADAGEAA